jgi:hypothetical protein
VHQLSEELQEGLPAMCAQQRGAQRVAWLGVGLGVGLGLGLGLGVRARGRV